MHLVLQTSITLCYFVGDDILKSHLMYNKNWAFVPREDTSGLTRYINDLTLEANKLLGKAHKIIWSAKWWVLILGIFQARIIFNWLGSATAAPSRAFFPFPATARLRASRTSTWIVTSKGENSSITCFVQTDTTDLTWACAPFQQRTPRVWRQYLLVVQ